MAKRADVELRIRSRNLAKKDLSELNDELDRFVKTQEKQSDAASLAARSLRDLSSEQRELAKIAAELSRRKSLVESLVGRQAELAAAKQRVNEIRAELAELLCSAPADPGAEDLLAQYAAQRSADREGVIGFTDTLVRMFSTSHPLVAAARDAGLLLFDVLPPAKRALSRVSLGFGSRTPRLARGLAP